MRYRNLKHAFLLLFLLLIMGSWTTKRTNDSVNWEAFISKHDLIFDAMPKKWQEAPYFGNGFIGSMVYQDPTVANSLIIQVFRTDVSDHRQEDAGWTAYSRPRLMIGYFSLTFKGDFVKTNLQQHLYTADLRAEISTTKGKIKIHHFIASSKDLIFTKIICSGDESYSLKWNPAEAKSTRKFLFPADQKTISKFATAYGEKYKSILKVYEPNPLVFSKQKNGVQLSVQNFLEKGQYAVAWNQSQKEDDESILTMTIQNSYPDKSAEKKAYTIIQRTNNNDFQKLFNDSRKWWSAFYRRSFLSIPDKELESLYWLQMYKIGASNRAEGPMMDTSGPWFQDTTWPYITWDLNVQLCYWPLNVSNHLDLAHNLPNVLTKNTKQLVANVKPEDWQSDAAYISLATSQDLKGSRDDDRRYYNLNGNLSWAMHNVWLQYKFNMNTKFLREKCYPLLKKSANYYLHLIKKEADGKYHIPIGYSPEYPGIAKGLEGESKDTNFDLALLKWNLTALIEAATILKVDETQQEKWKEILNAIAEYPVDENGFRIGADLAFAESHRHYSHLLMIYPLYLETIEKESNRELLEKSIKHWIGNPKKLAGYSYTGASSLSSAIGNGNDALFYLNGLKPFLTSNGLYQEGGRPVFETPLSAAQSIQDMVLQSWGNKIRFFPALPDDWKNISFQNLVTQGAFEVSASYKDEATDFITIKSLAGIPCIFVSTIKNPKAFVNKKEVILTQITNNTYTLALKKNQTAVVKRVDYHGDFLIKPVKN